jgi:hypothetical protein
MSIEWRNRAADPKAEGPYMVVSRVLEDWPEHNTIDEHNEVVLAVVDALRAARLL